MGSPTPTATKLKRESPTTKAGPHRRTSSVTSSCVSLESGDQGAQSPARSAGPGRSPVTASTSSPRTPAGVNPGEKSVSPAAVKKRRSSIGGADDLVRGLDFSTSTSVSSPVNEEKKLHSFLTKGGGHKKLAQPTLSVTVQTSSPGKKLGTTPPGKEKLVAGRATSASVLSPRKLSDGRDTNKKDTISPQKPVSASEGSNMNGLTTANSELGSNAEHVTPKKSSPLRVSLDGKLGKSSPRVNTKSKSGLTSTDGRRSSSVELAAVDSSVVAETKTDFKFSPGVSVEPKLIGKKSSSRPSLKSRSSLTSSTGRKLTKSRQDTPSSPQPGRVRTRTDKGARNEELSRPEMESVEVPVYSEYKFEREAKSENVVKLSHKMPALLQHGEVDEERSTLLASLMVGGSVGDEDMSSLNQEVEPGFDNDTELPTSWLSEDLPCMFSSLSHLPEPDDSTSSLFGDPPEVLDEPFQGSSNEDLLATQNDTVAAEIARSVVASSPKSPVSRIDEKSVAADDRSEFSNGVYQPAEDESTWNYESNSDDNMVDNSVDKFEAELRMQIDATYELESPQLSMPQVGDAVNGFEADLRTQINATNELVSPQPVGPVAISKSLLTIDKGETMPYKYTTDPEDISSSTSDNESSVSENVANEVFLQSGTQVTENKLIAEGRSQPISRQIVEDPAEANQVVPEFLEDDEEIFQLDPPSCAEHSINTMPNAKPTLHEEGRMPTVEDEISTNHSSLDQHVVESSDDEYLEGNTEESDTAQLNLKQSFDDVAEPLAGMADNIDISHPSIVMVGPEDTCGDALDQYTVGPQELASSIESGFAAEFLDGQDCGAFTPTYLDQDMKIFEEYWTQSVADESSQSDAGQNDAEDLQPSSMSETQLLNTVEDEAEKSLPPVELPVSILPVVGKLKLTVEESINLEPPGNSSAEVGATKLEIVDFIEETLPREGWPCRDSTMSLPTSDNYEIDAESANKEEVEEFDEVFHLFNGGSEDILFDNLSSASRPNALQEDPIQEPRNSILNSESFEEMRFENAGESDSSVSPRHTTSTLGTEPPHDTAHVVLDFQNRDVEGVAGHQDFFTKTFSVQNASVDDLLHDPHHVSIAGALEGPADQEPTHEDLGTPPMLVVNSSALLGVNIQHLDSNEAPDESLTSEDPDSSLNTPIQDASHESSFEIPAMSVTHMAVQSNEVLELGPDQNPAMLKELEFCASNLELTIEAGGDRNAALTDDDKSLMADDCFHEINNSLISFPEINNSLISFPEINNSLISFPEINNSLISFPEINNSLISSPNRDFSGLIDPAVAETDDSHDLGSRISSKLPMVEGDQTVLHSPQFSATAGSATKEVDPFESNALLPSEYGINDEEQTEANFLSSLDKELEESPFEAMHSEDSADTRADNIGEGHEERIENSVSALKLQMNFDQKQTEGFLSSVEEAEIMNSQSGCISSSELPSNFTEPNDNFENKRSQSREFKIEVPRDDSFQIHGDDEFRDDERITRFGLQIDVESHADVNMSEVEHKPHFMQLTPSQVTEILEDCLAKDDTPDYVTKAAVDKSLPAVLDGSSTHVSSVACSPVFNEEDDMITDKFDSKSEVNSTASLDMVIPGIEAIINSTDLTASTTDEAIDITAAATFVLSAKELPNTTLNEVGEFGRHESEFEVNEVNSLNEAHSKWGIVDLGEPSRAELDWEDPLLTADSSGSKSHTNDQRDLLCEEPVFTNASSSGVADARRSTREDLEIDQDKNEEASSISTSASAPSELKQDHDQDLQESQLPHGTSVSPDDEVSRTEGAAAIEKAFVTPSDAGSDEDLLEAALDDHAINDVEIIPENCSNQDLPSKLFITPSRDTPNAEILDADDMKEDSDFSWKVGEKEGESLNEILERNCFPNDVETVVDSPEKSFIVSAQDTVLNVYFNEMEEDSSFSKNSERDNVYFNGRLEDESLFEDEETVVFSPKNSYVNASGPDTQILSANDIQHHSNNIFWTAGKDEESSNGNGKEESLLEGKDTLVYSPKDRLEATILGANDIQNHSWKADSEEDYFNESLEEKSFLKDEDIVVDNSKKSFEVDSGQYATVSDVDEPEEQLNSSWIADKNEELNYGGLERDPVLEDEETIVPRLKSPFNVSVHETPHKTISGVNDIQNHLNLSWTTDKDELESLKGSLEEESSLEDEDTVVYRPTELLIMTDQDLPDTPLLVDDMMGKHWKFPGRADEGKSLNGFVKEAMLEVQETVLGNHEEALELVRNDMNEDAFVVDDVEKHSMSRRDERGEKNLNGNTLEKESIDEFQEMVDSSTESFIVPDLINTYAKNSDVDETEKQPKWKIDKEGGTLIPSLEEKSMFEVEEVAVDSPKESIVVSDEVNTTAVISDVYELEKHSTWTTDKEGESLNRNLEAQKKVMDSSSGNEKNASVCQVPEVNGSIQSINSDSGYRGEDLVSHSMTRDGAMTPHASDADALDISTDAVRLEDSAVIVNTDHVDEDSNLGESAALEDCKSCVIPEMINGNHLHESDRSHETVAEIETPVLAVKTVTSDLESNPQDMDLLEEATEPQIPESTLYPLPEGQTPFSGSQQDRLWEEQAEAYSSGGRGTPSRNDDATPASAPFHPPSSPGEQLTSSDDQIQPASGPMNNGHTVAGPSNGAGENGSALHEPKGKLHTPLRSLLLEDAGKSSDGGPSTSNAVTSSPSFIRRLFRVMSTPSRAAERDVSRAKLKKSSSMWVSCLGSPQVQQ